jgi:hypothetical protein
MRLSSVAICPTVVTHGVPMLSGVSPTGSGASRAATTAAATSDTWMKLRRWQPSSKTRGGSPRSRLAVKIDATPAYGVSRGIPWP